MDARLCAGEAMLKLGRANAALRLLEEQRPEIAARGDQDRLQRLDAILAGGSHRLDGESHAKLGVALLRDGQGEAALEHFRAARILLGG